MKEKKNASPTMKWSLRGRPLGDR
uniref:Uncharacterized protein n=1 Tax=Anguilla anguilla TaxID=7936 RepID=A0A0E9RG25_ANGAN